MSRLDDELKLAFRRKEPSADFTGRVLARIAAEQAKPQKLSLWQRLIGFFQMPTMRWAVAGAVILLIAAVGVIQYQRNTYRNDANQATLANNASSDNKNIAQSATASNGNLNSNSGVKQNEGENPAPKIKPNGELHRVQHVVYKSKRRLLPRRFKTDSVEPVGQVAKGNLTERERGEQAREQLYKALAITSSLLSEARTVAFGEK
jgi:hypothetical protein